MRPYKGRARDGMPVEHGQANVALYICVNTYVFHRRGESGEYVHPEEPRRTFRRFPADNERESWKSPGLHAARGLRQRGSVRSVQA